MPDEKLYDNPLGDALLTDEVSVIMDGHENTMDMFSQLFHPLPRRVLSRGMIVYTPPDYKMGRIVRITPDRLYVSILGNEAEESQRVIERTSKDIDKMEVVLPQISTNPIFNPPTIGTLSKAASKTKNIKVSFKECFAFPLKFAMTTPVVDDLGFSGYIVGATMDGYTIKGTDGRLFERKEADIQSVGPPVHTPVWLNKHKSFCKLVRTSSIGNKEYRGKGAIIKEMDPVTGLAEYMLPGVLDKDTLIAPLSVIEYPETADEQLHQAETILADASMYGVTPPTYGDVSAPSGMDSESTGIPVHEDNMELGIGDSVVMQTSDMDDSMPATVSRIYDDGSVDVEYASGLGSMETKRLSREELDDLSAEGTPGEIYKTSHHLSFRNIGERASDMPMFKTVEDDPVNPYADNNILNTVSKYARIVKSKGGKYNIVSTAGKIVDTASNKREAMRKLARYAAKEIKKIKTILAKLEEGFPVDTRLKVSRNMMGVPLYVKIVEPVHKRPILSKVMANPEVYYLELEDRENKDILVSTLNTYNNQPPINLKWASTRLPYVVEVDKDSLEKLAQIGVFSLVSWPGEDRIDDEQQAQQAPQRTPGGLSTPRISKKTAAIPNYPFDQTEFMATVRLKDGTKAIIRKYAVNNYNDNHPDNPIVEIIN